MMELAGSMVWTLLNCSVHKMIFVMNTPIFSYDKTRRPVKFISHEEYVALFTKHNTLNLKLPNTFKEEFLQARERLEGVLTNYGTSDAFGKGDFFIDDDFFGTRCLHIVICTWKMFRPEVFSEIVNFIHTEKQEYSVTCVWSMPDTERVEEWFKIFIDTDNIMVSFSELDEDQSRNLWQGFDVFRAIGA